MRRVILVLALTTAASACGGGSAAPEHRRDPGALVVANANGVIGLDPVRVTDSESIEVGELLFEGLVRWKPGTTDITPGLAASWRAVDTVTWRFELQANVLFHDGTPMDAAAVKFSFERLIDPKHPNYIKGEDGTYWRSLLKDIVRVDVIDARTVEIKTQRPYAPLVGDVAMFPIVSPVAVRRWGDAFKSNPVGTGPYVFESWTPGEQVVVKRFSGYWGKAPALDRIVFRVIVDARQRLVELESGSIDIATSILPDEQSFVELHPDLVLRSTPGNDVSYLAFNTQHPPFDDVRVRRAASFAINKEPIVKLAYQGRAIAADGPLPPMQWGYHKPQRRYSYDLVAARKLLAEATADGRFDPAGVYKLYSLSTPRPYLSQPERVGRYLQAALAQVGIRTELVLQPYAEHKKAVEAGEHDLAVFGWVGDTGDPDNFLYVLFHSDNAKVGAAQNIAFYKSERVDKLLVEAQGAPDEPTRSGLYAVVQDSIAADAPWVPLAHSELVVAARAELKGLILSPRGHPVYPLISRGEAR
ncbi:MAG: ABC transporter substrate-binding protein [Myxococcales bacterium]|nr:ABC transporter substrate-binding protein [Myxococcales bacterium]